MSNIKREELEQKLRNHDIEFLHGVAVKLPKGTVEDFMQLIDQYTQGKVDEARQIAKKENARDFSAVVIAFNEALVAVFDAPSVLRLRTVLNGADARANYIDLPAQLADRKEKK